jgi:hypothetical protein
LPCARRCAQRGARARPSESFHHTRGRFALVPLGDAPRRASRTSRRGASPPPV